MKRRAWVIVEGQENPEGTGPLVAIVEEGEEGYRPSDYAWGKTEDAQRIADLQNEALGLDRYDAEELKIRSMFPDSTITAQQLRDSRARR